MQIIMKKIIPIDFKEIFEASFKGGMNNGKVGITFDTNKKQFIIDAISKINANRPIYIGGFRIIINLGDENKRHLYQH